MSMISQLYGMNASSAGAVRNQAPVSQQTEGRTVDASSMGRGQILEGKITQIKGSEVQIELPGGQSVSARLENAMALSTGQTVAFEIRANNGAQITLSPLYTNMNLGATAQRALAAAGMEVNASTMEMTITMMDEGMGIDKNALGDMYGMISSHPGEKIANLVEMQRLGLPMDAATIENYDAFKNYESRLTDSILDLADSAVSCYQELTEGGDSAKALSFVRELAEHCIMAKETVGEAAERSENAALSKGSGENKALAQSGDEMGSTAPLRDGGRAAEAAKLLTEAVKSAAAEELAGGKSVDRHSTAQEKEAVTEKGIPDKAAMADKQEMSVSANTVLTEASPEDKIRNLTQELQTLLRTVGEKAEEPVADNADGKRHIPTAEELKALMSGGGAQGTGRENPAVRTMRMSQDPLTSLQLKLSELCTKVSGGEALSAKLLALKEPTSTELIRLTNAVVKELELAGGEFRDEKLMAAAKGLLYGEDFREVLKKALKDNWSLKPEEVGSKANVEELYERLTSQAKDISKLLGQAGNALGSENALSQSVQNLNNNLDFMNQLNQTLQYVQIPLKMSGSEATGDLYVYTDKKSLASKDGNVSALLHLSMEHMGNVDVYASISSGNRVSTKFYLETEEMIDFIAEHIHILNERLQKRGYQVKADITMQGEKETEAAEGEGRIRQLREGAKSHILSHQSFDVRA